MATDTATAVTDAVLVDGAHVAIRAVSPEDEPGLEALLGRMSIGSRWRRFFSGATNLHRAARFSVAGNGVDGVVAVAGTGREIVGHCIYVRGGRRRAEVAFEVADAWQGRGVGTLLLGAAAERAARDGIDTFTALVLSDNHAMIGVFRKAGSAIVVPALPSELSVRVPIAVGPDTRRRNAVCARAASVAAIGGGDCERTTGRRDD